MLAEKAYITVNGKRFTGWESVTVKRSIESLAGTFDFSATDHLPDGNTFEFLPGMSATVQAGTDLLITGYINDVEPEVSDESDTLKISGRCRTQDLIDCSAENPSSSWSKPTPLISLCNDLARPFGIQAQSHVSTSVEKVDKFMLNAGESPFEAVQRLCADRALLPISDERGNLILAQAGALRAFDALAYGYNVMKASGKYSDADRFQKYTVKGDEGSDGGGWTESKISVSGTAYDLDVKRFRVKIIKAAEQMNSALAKKKAAWEAQVRAGRAGEVSVTVAGWRQSNGVLWRENMLTVVDIPKLKIKSTELLIVSVTYTQDSEGGTTADLVLKRPDIYTADPSTTVKKLPKKVVWNP